MWRRFVSDRCVWASTPSSILPVAPSIGHNERTKEKYASNPDVDTSRSKYNFHLGKPPVKYRAESERQIAAAGCRTRKDSIRMIETLFTASPEFFKGKKRASSNCTIE